MKHDNCILLGITFTVLSVSILAQTQPKGTTVNRIVVIEQQYNLDVVDASEVNILPKAEEPIVNKREAEYVIFTMSAIPVPMGTTRAYTGKEIQPDFIPGYARLGYGNYGNLDILANYLFRLSDQDKLNVSFRMDEMDGKLGIPLDGARKWNVFYYRIRANVDYAHQFTKLDLDVAGNFSLNNFNYEPYEFKKQRSTSGGVHLGVRPTDETLPLQYRAETNLMLCEHQQCQLFGGTNETLIRTLAIVSGSINDEQTVAAGFAMNNLTYGNGLKENKDRIKNIFKSRTMLDLNPHYELNDDSWRIHVGANVDLSFGNGKAVRVSPDVKVQYVSSDSYVLHTKVTRGRQLSDFHRLETYNPYLDPGQEVRDTYEQPNAGLGFKASPIPGLWFDMFGGYQDLRDDLYQPADQRIGRSRANCIALGQTNMDNFYAGIKASYEYKDLFALSTGGTYYRWSTDNKGTDSGASSYDEALLMKPEFNLGIHTGAHPIPALWLNAGYQYTRRAERYSIAYGKSIPAVSNLSLGVTYKIFKGISAYVKANDLLNEKHRYYLHYPIEEINFVGGLNFQL